MSATTKMGMALATAGLVGLAAPAYAVSTPPPAGADAESGRAAPVMVVFDRLPGNAVPRLRRVGVTHAAVFEGAKSAAVVAPVRSHRRIASWPDVVALYPATSFRPAMFEAKAQTGVDRVLAGDRPLSGPYTGRGVTVAVLDTGIDTAHPDLGDRVTANLDFEASGVLDAISDDRLSRPDPETPAGVDEYGHGTLVTGVLAGSGDAAAGSDLRGVAPDATLVNLRFGGAALIPSSIAQTVPEARPVDAALNGVYDEPSLLAAMQWILDHRDDPRFPGGIRVVNNSWGTPDPGEGDWPLAMTRMVETLIAEGVVMVFAAGNTPPPEPPGPVWFPGSLPAVIAVGANCKSHDDWSGLCGDGGVAAFSNRGPALDLVAPGVGIWGAHAKEALWVPPGWGDLIQPGADPPPPGYGTHSQELNNRLFYTWGDGTSVAAPHVAGVVALMLEANPSLTPARIARILQRTATDIGPDGFDEAAGHGQVDAFAAVRRAARAARQTTR